jgi:hypothetical protein
MLKFASRAIVSATLMLLAGCSGADGERRQEVASRFENLLHQYDANADGSISRAEWGAAGEKIRNPKLKAAVLADFASTDTDGDGSIGRSELLDPPLRTFDCMDQDRNAILTDAEKRAGFARCAKPTNVPGRTGT